jgi:hypothetical protein
MPEIKNTFTSGRMNKDFDERLIPKGEYRDALNIDIATSESSEVGTAQNVMGNKRVSTIGITAQQCVGSVADTKNDKIYWFISGNDGEGNDPITGVDAIAEYSVITKKITPILVDTGKGTANAFLNFTTDKQKDSNKHFISGVNVIVDDVDGGETTTFLVWTDNKNEPKKINIERCRSGSTNFSTTTKLYIDGVDLGNILEEHITVIKKSPLNAPDLTLFKTTDESRDQTKSISAIFESGAAKNYDGSHRSCSPSDPNSDGYGHCDFTKTQTVAVGGTTSGEEVVAREKGNRLIAGESGNFQQGAGAMQFKANGRIGFEAGDIIKLTSQSVDLRIQQYVVKVKLLKAVAEDGNSKTFNAEIVYVDPELATANLMWDCELEQGDSLFELIFPRFAYRWKYVDGEYSCYSPFTNVAFLPSQENPGFEYNPVDAYNVSMVNALKGLRIGGGTSMPFDTRPKDVIEVDILYKESNTTNTYTITTFKTNDEMNSVESGGEGFKVKSEQVHAVLPSNQLLRPWDNVPRKARAQEITKNRIVYGNYLQNFNVPENPKFIVTPTATQITDGLADRSLKSIRNYQVGIVFLDKYGRQTPVLSDNSAALKLDQTFSSTANKLNVQVLGDLNSTPNRELTTPTWATHYRYFIKEPSLEYYNIALDRHYRQEDSAHVWLSFASAERNKIDDETYLILKKRHESNEPLDLKDGTTYKYKVITVQNEAPKSIRKKKRRLGKVTTQFSTSEGLSNIDPTTGFPVVDSMYFNINGDTMKNSDLEAIDSENPNELYVKILSPTSETGYYQLSSISQPGGHWKFGLQRALGTDVGFILNASTGKTKPNLSLEIYKEETIDLPEFDGRFFVKIKRDDFLDNNLLSKNQQPKFAKQFSGYLHYISYIKSDTLESNINQHESRASKEMYMSSKPGDWKDDGVNTTAFSIDDAVYYPEDGNSSSIGTTRAPAWSEGSNKMFIRLTNCGAAGQLVTEHPTMEMFPTEDDYKFHQALSTEGTIFKFTNDTRNDGDGVIQTIYSVSKEAVYNYKHKSLTPNIGLKYKLKDKQKRWVSNHGLRYTIVTRPFGQKEHEGIGWTQLTASGAAYPLDFSSKSPIHKAGTDGGELSMAKKVFASNGISYSTQVEILKEIKNELTFSSRNPAIFETEPKPTVDLDLYYETSKTYPISNLGNIDTIDYSNCWSYGNGAESNRIRDDYNAVIVDKGPKVSTVFAEQYQEERRSTGMIYSGIYNSSSGVNRLNQFIQAEKITKDVNPEYGSIQKLSSRDADLIVLCEDKSMRVLANKDALYNADGNVNLTASSNVLGQTIPFVGDYGISTNPESFASFGFRSYYTDKRRGAVLRLSRDGLTNIAYKGMRDWFSDNMKQPTTILGNYDERKDNYNVTLIGSSTKTLSFSELVNGWTSFKSFIPESALTLNNTYYSFYAGDLWEHNKNSYRNKFYDTQYFSTIKLIFNDEPSVIKNFKTLNYEGTTSRLYKTTERGYAAGTDTTLEKEGWYCNSVTTGEQDGDVPYFINKEGKWFGNLHGSSITVSNLENDEAAKEFKVQGIGNLASSSGSSRAGYHVKISVQMDTSDDTSNNDFEIPTSFTIDGTTYDNTVANGYHVAPGTSVSKEVFFYFEPNNANSGGAGVMKATDFSFVSEDSLTETDAVTNASVAFTDTVGEYTVDNKVKLKVPIVFTMPSNDQTIVVKITGGVKHINTVSGKWYSTVSNTSVPTSSNTAGTAFSATGFVGETVTIDLDPSGGGTTTTFTAAEDYLFYHPSHPFVDLSKCYLLGSNYRVTETPAFGSTGNISTKAFAITYKIPDYSVTDDEIHFYATPDISLVGGVGDIDSYTLGGQTKETVDTTITTGVTSATQTVADTQGILIGSVVSGNGVPFGSMITVISITNATTLVLSESITTTLGDTYTFTKPSLIEKGGAIDRSLKVYGNANAIFDVFLVKDSDGTSLLKDSGGDIVDSIRGTIPSVGGDNKSYHEELLTFPTITSGSATYTLTLQEVVGGDSNFVNPLVSPEKVKFAQFTDATVTLTASESSSNFSLSATALGSKKAAAFTEGNPDMIGVKTVLTSSVSNANLKFTTTVDSNGDGTANDFNYTNWTHRDKDDTTGYITLTNGTILSFMDMNITIDNSPSNATATFEGIVLIHEYGSDDDTSVLNFDNIIEFINDDPVYLDQVGGSAISCVYETATTVTLAATDADGDALTYTIKKLPYNLNDGQAVDASEGYSIKNSAGDAITTDTDTGGAGTIGGNGTQITLRPPNNHYGYGAGPVGSHGTISGIDWNSMKAGGCAVEINVTDSKGGTDVGYIEFRYTDIPSGTTAYWITTGAGAASSTAVGNYPLTSSPPPYINIPWSSTTQKKVYGNSANAGVSGSMTFYEDPGLTTPYAHGGSDLWKRWVWTRKSYSGDSANVGWCGYIGQVNASTGATIGTSSAAASGYPSPQCTAPDKDVV